MNTTQSCAFVSALNSPDFNDIFSGKSLDRSKPKQTPVNKFFSSKITLLLSFLISFH